MDMRKLLEVAKCPNAECRGGAIPHKVGEDEWDAEQCQWCAEREEALSHIGDDSKAEPAFYVSKSDLASATNELNMMCDITANAFHFSGTVPVYLRPGPTAQDSKVPEYRNALVALTEAEAQYRYMHDLHGDGHLKAGRAWDAMRRAGDSARLLLSAAPVPDKPQRSIKADAVKEFCTEIGLFAPEYSDQGYIEVPRWKLKEYIDGLQRPEAPEGER